MWVKGVAMAGVGVVRKREERRRRTSAEEVVDIVWFKGTRWSG